MFSNLEYTKWKHTNQLILSLICSSLIKEAMSEIVGLMSSYETWQALESPFSHKSKTRELQLKGELQIIKKGTKSVVEYSRAFKTVCDQLFVGKIYICIANKTYATEKLTGLLYSLLITCTM